MTTERAGLLQHLEQIASIIPPPIEIIIIGSGALCLRLLPDHKSVDADLIDREGRERVLAAVRELGLEKTREKEDRGIFCVEIVPSYVFTAPRHWLSRTMRITLPNGHTLLVPDPIDIIVSKIPQYQQKDKEDIKQIFEAIGRPDQSRMIDRLQEAVLMYRPSTDEWSFFGDPWTNTRDFFKDFYQRDIDVQKEIVIPGLAVLRAESGLDPNLPPIPSHQKHHSR